MNLLINRVALIFVVFCLMVILLLPACSPGNQAKDPFEYPVLNSDIVVYGVITAEKSYTVTSYDDGRIGKTAYTVFILAVDKTIKGDPKIKEVPFMKEGGRTPEVIIERPPYVQISDKVLLCLDKEGEYTDSVFRYRFTFRRDSLLWIEGTVSSGYPVKEAVCRVIKIMRKNNRPVALDPSEIPCPPLPLQDRIYQYLSDNLLIILIVISAIFAVYCVVLTGTRLYRRH